MKILKIIESKPYLVVTDKKTVEISQLNREDLLTTLKTIYDSTEEYNFNYESDLEEIVNPVEKELTKQIMQKIKEFYENRDNLLKEVQDKFPQI